MAFPWAAVIGAASSFLGGRAKAAKNPFLDYMIRAIGRSEGIVQNINFEDLDQRTLEAYRKEANRAGDLAISRQNASDFATGGTPMADSERGVARGVIGKAVGDAIGSKSAELEATRYQRQLDAWNQVFGMGASGYGPQSQQNQLNAQAQSAQNSAIFNIANSLFSGVGNRGAGGTTGSVGSGDYSSGGYTPPVSAARSSGTDETYRRLRNEGIFV